jgi:hypothetical protein
MVSGTPTIEIKFSSPENERFIQAFENGEPIKLRTFQKQEELEGVAYIFLNNCKRIDH